MISCLLHATWMLIFLKYPKQNKNIVPKIWPCSHNLWGELKHGNTNVASPDTRVTWVKSKTESYFLTNGPLTLLFCANLLIPWETTSHYWKLFLVSEPYVVREAFKKVISTLWDNDHPTVETQREWKTERKSHSTFGQHLK